MITFTQCYPVAPRERSATNASAPYEEPLWRLLVSTVLEAEPDPADLNPEHPAQAVDHERQVLARGEQVLEHVHLDAASRRVVITRLTGRERGCLSYEVADRHDSQELVVTACLAVNGVSAGSAAEQHIADWYGAEQYAFARRIVTDAGRVNARLSALS